MNGGSDNVTDDMVERLRRSLWATWGEGRQTTDWPSERQLRAALEAALEPVAPAVAFAQTMSLARRRDARE